MRPDDPWDGQPGGGDAFGPLDADLEALDAELGMAGAQGRRALRGQTQPTRFFSNRLRDRLLRTYSAAISTPAAAVDPSGRSAGGVPVRPRPTRSPVPMPVRGGRSELAEAGETWAPVALEPRVSRRAPAPVPRARWGLLAAATLTAAIAAAAVGAQLDWTSPEPTVAPSLPVVAIDATTRPSAPPVATAAAPVPSAAPTAAPEASATAPAPTQKPKPTPTPKPTPKPTQKPDPTKAPLLSMDLLAKACPGGVILDWSKPSADVGHYHVLRSLGGDVPATYPAAGTTDVETATSDGAGTTDGFDPTVEGGSSATYRAFAFDAGDAMLGYSPSRTVTTIGRISMGALDVAGAGSGSIDVSWAPPAVNDACFTYGKLVASVDDPDPSYLKGTPYLAVIESPSATGIHLDGLPSGKTVWMRYEIIRATSLGKFVVARTSVVQVTIP